MAQQRTHQRGAGDVILSNVQLWSSGQEKKFWAARRGRTDDPSVNLQLAPSPSPRRVCDPAPLPQRGEGRREFWGYFALDLVVSESSAKFSPPALTSMVRFDVSGLM